MGASRRAVFQETSLILFTSFLCATISVGGLLPELKPGPGYTSGKSGANWGDAPLWNNSSSSASRGAVHVASTGKAKETLWTRLGSILDTWQCRTGSGTVLTSAAGSWKLPWGERAASVGWERVSGAEGAAEWAQEHSRYTTMTWKGRFQRRVLKRMQAQAGGGKGAELERGQAKKAARRAALWGGAVSVPKPPNSYFTTPFKSIKGKGPCRRVSSPVVIEVRNFNDFKKRMRHPPVTTVVLQVHSGFPVPRGLVLSKNYSCTIIAAAKGQKPILTSDGSKEPVLTIHNAHNILMYGISIHHSISPSAQPCKFYLFTNKNGKEKKGLTCPGLFIARSFGIQVTGAKVYGRIDVFRSMFVKLDSLSVTTAENTYDKNAPYRSTSTFGIIRMGTSDLGAKFVATNNIISNCEVYGGWKLITIYQGAVGVTLRNNNLHHFYMASIQCGAFDGNTFDCHNNYLGYNIIWNPKGWETDKKKTDPDNAGIYTFIHWFNPNNYLTCNYIENQRHGIYLDSASSGVTVNGGVCFNTGVGVKVNNGKYNTIKNLVVTNGTQFMSYVTCITAQRYIWPKAMDVRMWEGVRRKFYDTPEINRAYPWMRAIVNPVRSSINGVNCNPKDGLGPEKTGKCSGLAYGNTVETFAYITPPIYKFPGFTLTPYWGNCERIPAMSKLNTQKWHRVPGSQFDNPKKFDFGIRSGAALLRRKGGFLSCPRRAVGRKRVYFRAYLNAFNIPRPRTFNAMLEFETPPRVLADA